MSDQARICPFCKESVAAEAVRCNHCAAAIPLTAPTHKGTCPYCKESINPEAIRCKHCHADLFPGVSVAYPRKASVRRRTFVKPDAGTLPQPRAATCPPAILDSSPDGSGIGVWILVGSDAETCTYEYGGGIV